MSHFYFCLKKHGMAYHCYADDAQIYQVIKPLDNWDDISDRLEDCLFDIKSWMCTNMLKLNQDKTELIKAQSQKSY
jgi:hypothetical protein